MRVDPKALKILNKYWRRESNNMFKKTTEEEIEILRQNGLFFEEKAMGHDETVAWALDEYGKCDKKSIVDNFLVGVGRNQPQLRAALSAYAIMTHFPRHECQLSGEHWCRLCTWRNYGTVDYTFLNEVRYGCGVAFSDVEYYAFFLERHRLEEKYQPNSEDIALFKRIMMLILDSSDDEKPITLYKKTRKIPGLKMNVEQARHFLELLGHAGILQTEKHKGFIYEYTSLGYAPHSSRSSYWSYPVDFWRGSDGVCKDAFLHWFGEYEELAELAERMR
jgi:hypothetical protein